MRKQKELPITFHDRLDSSFLAIEPVCMELKAVLERCGFSEYEFKLIILLREAFSNAVLHGNKFDPSKKIDCAIRLTGDFIEIEITDEGNGFDWAAEMKKPFNALDDCGRGLVIIKLYADEIRFNEKGNKITLRKTFSGIPAEALGIIVKDNIVHIALNGDLTASTIENFSPVLMKTISENENLSAVIFDLKRTRMVDSFGITLMTAIYKKTNVSRVKLINCNNELINLFRTVKLDLHFEINT